MTTQFITKINYLFYDIINFIPSKIIIFTIFLIFSGCNLVTNAQEEPSSPSAISQDCFIQIELTCTAIVYSQTQQSIPQNTLNSATSQADTNCGYNVKSKADGFIQSGWAYGDESDFNRCISTLSSS